MAGSLTMPIEIVLTAVTFDKLSSPRFAIMKDSTAKFIEKMRSRYGNENLVGRGNILNFGGQVTFAIRYSKRDSRDTCWFAVQSDFLDNKLRREVSSPLGIHTALICGDEQHVVIIPQELMAVWMADSPSDRIHVTLKDSRISLRISNHPLVDVSEYLNKYPGASPEGETAEESIESITSAGQQQSEITAHTEIQWMLIKFGIAAGYSVWVPPGDRGKEFGEKFADLTLPQLPNFGFDSHTNQIISNIDVLWFEGNVILKAFEIESTTSVYSGLLRLSDLVLSQPNTTIELYIVAPTNRRELVKKNILRPTFARLRPKCSYISFDEVTTKYSIVRAILAKQKARIRDLLEGERF